MHLVASGVSSTTINATISGFSFLFSVTLGKPQVRKLMDPIQGARQLPIVLSPADVRRFIDATSSLKHKPVVCNVLLPASAETLLTIAGNPRHLGA